MKWVVLTLVFCSFSLVYSQDETLDDVQRILGDLKDTTLAIQVLRAAVADDNSNWTYLYNLALLYHKTGKNTQAIPYFERAVRADSMLVQPMYYLGNYHFSQGSFKKAVAFYSLYLSGDEENREIRYKRAEAYMKLGDYYGAITDWSYLIRLEATPDLFFNRALSRLALNDLEGAGEDFEQVIELDRGFTDAYYFLGLRYFSSLEYKKADKLWRETIKLDPAYVNAYYQLAILNQKLKKISRTCKYLREAVELGWSPTDENDRELLEYCNER